MGWYNWSPYVPVDVRRARAMKKMAKLRKKGVNIQPVEIEGRKIARTFWGKAWCDHLESFSDYANRLPRGRTYVRNGSVCHLEITNGEIHAMVIGSDLYNVNITIKTLPRKKWQAVKKRCAGQISSLLELLQGNFSENVMAIVTNQQNGLFPRPKEITMDCDCPDWAVMCKHVAAVLYGVGARLDENPELLFLLRGVDHEELISAEVSVKTVAKGVKGDRRRIADESIADIFGIEMSEDTPPARKRVASKSPKRSVKTTKGKSKRKSNSGKKTAQSPKISPGVKRRPAVASNIRPITGKSVAALREKFGMSKSQFARLLGVSTPSISNWEKKRGALNLQKRTLDKWNAVKGLTKRKAWHKLDRS